MEKPKFIEQREVRPEVTIDSLKEQGNTLRDGIMESANAMVLALAGTEGDWVDMDAVKDYLQRQRLPSIEVMRQISPREARILAQKESDKFMKERREYFRDGFPLSREHINVMLGIGESSNPSLSRLPKFSYDKRTLTRSLKGTRKDGSHQYRVNVADHPHEDREELWFHVVRELAEMDQFKLYGFDSKIIGSVKTDGLIFYFGEHTIDAGLNVVLRKLNFLKHGKGEKARFAQRVDAKIPGLSVSTDPLRSDGTNLGTFGLSMSVGIGQGLSDLMQEGMKKEVVMGLLLDQRSKESEALFDRLTENVERTLTTEVGGKKLHNNIAFFDQA